MKEKAFLTAVNLCLKARVEVGMDFPIIKRNGKIYAEKLMVNPQTCTRGAVYFHYTVNAPCVWTHIHPLKSGISNQDFLTYQKIRRNVCIYPGIFFVDKDEVFLSSYDFYLEVERKKVRLNYYSLKRLNTYVKEANSFKGNLISIPVLRKIGYVKSLNIINKKKCLPLYSFMQMP